MTPTDDRPLPEANSHVHAPAAEPDLHRRDAALALALDATLTSIWDYEAAGNRVTFDRNWARMLGEPEGETITTVRGLLRRVHADERHHAAAAILDCLAGRKTEFAEEYRLQDARGNWVWVHSNGRVLTRDARGRGLRMIGTNVDITRRKTSELATSRELQFLRAINRTAVDLLQRPAKRSTLEALAQHAAELLEAALVEIALVENDLLVTHAAGGEIALGPRPPATRTEAVLSWRAIDRREPQIVEDFSAFPAGSPAYQQARFRAVALFPILLEDRTLGVFAFLRDRAGQPFSAEDREKGLLLAQMAAVAIQRASTYEDALSVAEQRADALQAHEKIFRHFVDHINQGFYTSDRRSLFTYCNPAISAVTGLSDAELLGTSSFRLAAAEDRPRVIQLYRELAAGTETSVVVEFLVDAQGGRKLLVEQTTHILRDADGGVREYRSFLRDITERKRAEVALQESERLYRTLVETVTHAYYVADRRSLFTYTNPAMNTLGGFQPGELLGQSSFRLITPEDRPRIMAAYRVWSADPKMDHAVCEFRVQGKNGREFWVEQTTNFVRDDAGVVIEGRNVLHDISDRKAAEAALQESEERFRGVFDKSPLVIALLSYPEGKIVEVNASAESIFGSKFADVRGRTSSELGLWVNPADRERYLTCLREQGYVPSFEAQMRRRDGTVLTALYSGALVTIGGRQYSLNTIQDISERKAAEAARDRSLAIAQATLESTADGILVVDAAGRIERSNAIFARMWRVPPEIIASGDNARSLAWGATQVREPGDFLRRVAELDATPFAESSDEVHFKDGRIFERSSRPLIVDARAAGRVWSFRDVTAARRADAALRESEARFKSVFEESPLPLILFDAPSGRIIEVNRAASETFLCTREEAVGKTTLELGIWEDLVVREQMLAQLSRGEDVRSAEITLRVKRDQPINVIFNISHVTVAGRACLLSSVIDITARKRAESLFRDLFAFSPDACIIATARGEIIDVNQRVLEMFGYAREELIGANWTQLVPEGDRARLIERLEKYFAHPVVHPMGRSAPGLVASAKDGRIFPIDISLSPLQSGGEIRIVAAIRDLTLQLKAEEALRQSEAQLRQAQKMESLGTLAGGIAHDFNNILTGILGYTQLALSDLPDGHAARPWLDGTLKSGERAKNLVSQILTFSRKTGTTRSPVRLQQVVIEAVELLRSILPAMVQFDSHVDAGCAPVLANANELHQVILNLCTNSWHALPAHGGRIEIELAPVAVSREFAGTHPPLLAGPHVRLSVRDNGAGMSPATIERIFEPFFTTKEAGKGTGLGLAVVHSVVAAHAGGVFVQSQPGVGTLFEIFLPTIAAEEPAPAKISGELARGHGETLLVVDDEPGSGEVISQLAERLGYRPTYCAEPLRAVALLRERRYDVLLTDLAMPGMTGEELARLALSLHPAMPVLLMSGFIEPKVRQVLEELGVREIVAKPPALADLAAALQRGVQRGTGAA